MLVQMQRTKKGTWSASLTWQKRMSKRACTNAHARMRSRYTRVRWTWNAASLALFLPFDFFETLVDVQHRYPRCGNKSLRIYRYCLRLRFLFSESMVRIFAARLGYFPRIYVFGDAVEQVFLKWPKSASCSSLKSPIPLICTRVAPSNDAVFKKYIRNLHPIHHEKLSRFSFLYEYHPQIMHFSSFRSFSGPRKLICSTIECSWIHEETYSTAPADHFKRSWRKPSNRFQWTLGRRCA